MGRTVTNYEDFLLARENLKSAEHIFEDVFRQVFRPGVEITWTRGGSRCIGPILRVGYGADRIEVQNAMTGKHYWIHVSSCDAKPN